MISLAAFRRLARNNILTPISMIAFAAQPVLAFTNTTPDTDGYTITGGDTVLVNNSMISNATTPGTITVQSSVGVTSINNAIGASITATNASAIVLGNGIGDFTNAGTVTAGSTSFAAALWVNSGNVTNFTNSGTMSADRFNVVYIGDDFNNVISNVGTFTNTGNLIGHFDQVVRITGTTGTFINSGNITSDADTGILLKGAVTTFNNSGTISATDLAARLLGGLGTGTNSGNIIAGTGVNQTALNIQTAGGSFTNSGTISGYYGLFIGQTATGATVVNSGTIRGATGGAAVTLSDNADGLTLTGTSVIEGLVDARGGVDTLILGGSTNGTFAVNEVGGTGQYRNFEAFQKTGSSTWTLAGNNVVATTLVANGGAIRANGVTPNLIFNLTGTTLGGNGTVGAVTMDGTSRISPGNSIGTLTTGTVTFANGSVFDVELGGSTADLLRVLGTATLTGATVNLMLTGNVCGGVNTAILTTTGGIVGTFAGINTTAATLTYDANNVYLTIAGQGRTYVGTGTTPNQQIVAAALDALGCNNQPYSAQLLALSSADIPAALDALSGEGHASIAGAMVEDSSYIREAVIDRIDQAFAALDADGAASNFMPGSLFDPANIDGLTFWGSAYGGVRNLAGNANSAATTSSAGGVIFGADGKVSEDLRLGLLAGFGTSRISARSTTGTSTDLSVGAYGGAHAGLIDLKFGVSYTQHLIQTARSIVFPGVNDTMTASYGAGTAQAFLEASTDINTGDVTLTPFARVAGVAQSTQPFTETGGQGQLTTAAATNSALFVTLGIGAETSFVLGNDMLVTAHGSIGWRHAFASAPVATNSFVGGGPFSVTGTGPTTDAAVLSAGLSFDLSANLSADLSYDGTIGSGSSSHAVKFTLAGKF